MFIDLIIGSLHEISIIFVLYNNARNTTRKNISKKRKFHFKFYKKTEVAFLFLFLVTTIEIQRYKLHIKLSIVHIIKHLF